MTYPDLDVNSKSAGIVSGVTHRICKTAQETESGELPPENNVRWPEPRT